MDLLLVNIPVDLGKKPYDLAFPFLKRLNFGLLAIATYMSNKGYEVAIFDPQVYPYEDALTKLLQHIARFSPNVVGLSCISGFSYPSCKEFASAIRRHFGSIKIVVGGKDHIGQIGEAALRECSAIDLVVRGEGEEVICQVIESFKSAKPLDNIPNIVYRTSEGQIYSTLYSLALTSQPITQLNYNLYPEFNMFAPSLEVSRGCTFGCDFCVSARTGVRKKEVSLIVDEAEYITRMYKDDKIPIYFETPMFLMRDDEISQFVLMKRERNLNFTWRTETRVDYLTPLRLRNLAEAGLRVVDLGLESASPEILLRMGKTRNPEGYLRKAADALRTAHELGVIIKLNVLFYLGETSETIKMTLSFLEENLPYIRSLSAYPLLLYPGSSLETGIEKDIKQYGGSIVEDSCWQDRHLWPVNPSAEFTYEALQELGLLFTKSFQTKHTFYMQKRYGYFSPGISYSEFVQYVNRLGNEQLPFSKNTRETQTFRQQLWKRLDHTVEHPVQM